MSHYFDDILTRHFDAQGPKTPKSPVGFQTPRLRRTSTARSIAGRSDFDANDLNGYADEADGNFPRRVDSMVSFDPGRAKEREAADEHLHSYITQQLERVRLEQGADGYSGGEEFEAQP
jgi:hypothetical protein